MPKLHPFPEGMTTNRVCRLLIIAHQTKNASANPSGFLSGRPSMSLPSRVQVVFTGGISSWLVSYKCIRNKTFLCWKSRTFLVVCALTLHLMMRGTVQAGENFKHFSRHTE
jgi:hypothetical protein